MKVAEVFDLNGDLINPIRSSELGWKANRPKNTSLNSEKVEKLLNIKLKKVDECLNELKKII